MGEKALTDSEVLEIVYSSDESLVIEAVTVLAVVTLKLTT